MDLAAPRDAHLNVGEVEAEQGQDPQAPLRRQLPAALQRRPVDRDQEVDWHRIRPEPAQVLGQVHDVLVALSHPEQRS